MKKYIKSSVVELKDGSTENITNIDDFRYVIEEKLGTECLKYFDEIMYDTEGNLQSLENLVRDCLPNMDKDCASYVKKVLDTKEYIDMWF